ncbi:MAG: hypothetical protein Q9160_005811 [Pyrenula sp. 1 TL-2023]
MTKLQSPYRLPRRSRASWNVQDSPSRQLLTDLESELQRLKIHLADVHKVHLHDRITQQNGFDERDAEVAKQQLAGLNRAYLHQEAIRKDAEAELEAWRRKVAEEEAQRKRIEEERRRREEEEARRQAERQKREREEAERRAAEERAKAEAIRLEAEKKAKEEAEQKIKREAEQKAKAEAEEKARQERKASAQQEVAAKAKAKAESERQAAAKQKADAVQTSLSPSNPQKEAVHQRYIQIHQNLKKFRKPFWDQCKKDANLKQQVGDIRRKIQKSVAQLVDLKGNSKALPIEELEKLTPAERRARAAPPSNAHALKDVRECLQLATTIPTTTIDIREFLASSPPELANNPSVATTAPALLIYALNIFSKSIIAQLANEASVSPARAEPLGVIAAQIFPLPEFSFNQTTPLIDILLAKYHIVCPPLFGITGLESSAQGRNRLGWWKEMGKYIPSARHHDRMTGFAAGYAALSLRNFSKSRFRNPYPPHHFWETITWLLDLPPAAVQPTHLTILKGLIVQSVERFLVFYGEAAVAVLRRVFTSFLDRLPDAVRKESQVGLLRTLGESLARDFRVGVV